jgi:hypothetical protein
VYVVYANRDFSAASIPGGTSLLLDASLTVIEGSGKRGIGIAKAAASAPRREALACV